MTDDITMTTTPSPPPGVIAGGGDAVNVVGSPSQSQSGAGWGGGFNSIRSSFGGLIRHDSEFSVTSKYNYKSSNDLNVWQGAALLTADCLGTG
jgi:hypothetical protein